MYIMIGTKYLCSLKVIYVPINCIKYYAVYDVIWDYVTYYGVCIHDLQWVCIEYYRVGVTYYGVCMMWLYDVSFVCMTCNRSVWRAMCLHDVQWVCMACNVSA